MDARLSINKNGCYLRSIVQHYNPNYDLINNFNYLIKQGVIDSECWVADPAKLVYLVTDHKVRVNVMNVKSIQGDLSYDALFAYLGVRNHFVEVELKNGSYIVKYDTSRKPGYTVVPSSLRVFTKI